MAGRQGRHRWPSHPAEPVRPPRFLDREDAGRRLSVRLAPLRLPKPVVLALPRGGVPVAAEVAASLDAPLDVFVARKIGMPGREEAGIGAVAEGLDEPVALELSGAAAVPPHVLEALVEVARAELSRRVELYRGLRPLPDLRDADVVLVDDGLATGVTAEAALLALRTHRPRRVVLAVPVCAPEPAARLAGVADDVVFELCPRAFRAVGEWYVDFTQTTDGEVLRLLAAHAGR